MIVVGPPGAAGDRGGRSRREIERRCCRRLRSRTPPPRSPRDTGLPRRRGLCARARARAGAPVRPRGRSTTRNAGAARIFGLRAETIAALLAAPEGLSRSSRANSSSRGGEIDLIARRGESIAFVEVKARDDLETALAARSARQSSGASTARARLAGAQSVGRWARPFAATLFSSRPGDFPATRRPRIASRFD